MSANPSSLRSPALATDHPKYAELPRGVPDCHTGYRRCRRLYSLMVLGLITIPLRLLQDVPTSSPMMMHIHPL